uniref:ribosomal protein L20 n=1 Tax=Asplenium castaneoviride TaxID=2601855 RepID=UPI0023AA6316|nr:ribosomal protein L20 [Asplenium castaneoviride]YP_010702270.1 ribosomal protein L20 [Asplenium ruprechtii]WCL38466.1 ribosomal protein L20 [Asplenium castaneoviride]WCL38554.1 ribosomal protein L20 [Asplenium castaneoviride]WCL38642.1 ribosomal protein L20 [Asplenium ruprechtii]
MTRVKRGSISRRYHKSILNFASGFRGAHSKLFRAASQQERRALACAYVDRSNRKRRFRRLWIVRINAAARKNGTTYSLLIHKLLENQVFLNRRVLAQVATLDARSFSNMMLNINSNEH